MTEVNGVQFNTEEEDKQYGGFRFRPIEPPKGFYEFFVKNGFAKNNEEAGKLMLAITIGAIIIGILYPFVFGYG